MWALFRREFVRGFLVEGVTLVAGPALQSVLFAGVFILALGDADVTMGGLDFAAFLIPGLIIFTALERGFEATAFMIVYDKLEGMVTDMLAAPLNAAEITTAYAMMAATAAVATGGVTWLALLPFVQAWPEAPLVMLAFAALGGLMLGLAGLAAGLWADKWDHISGFQTLFVIPAIYMSGVFFSLDRLPDGLRLVAGLNPVYYAIDGFRYGMTGRAGADPGTALIVVVAVDILLWLVCWRLVATGYKLKP